MEGSTSPRIRVNLSETTKGVVSVDVTAESDGSTDIVKRAIELLADARSGLIANHRRVTPLAPEPEPTGPIDGTSVGESS